MCGRVRLSSDVSEIKLVFSIPPHRPTPNIAASWNVAPTDPLPAVRYDAKAGDRSLDVLRWVWCRSGLRTSTSVFPISTPKPRGSKGSRRSERHSSGGAVRTRGRLLRMERDRDRKAARAIALADRS